MNRQQLETQFEILKKDVSGLLDTNYFARIEHDDEGRYYLKPYGAISNNEGRVARVLGAICPDWGVGSIKSLIRNTRTNSLPEGYSDIERTVLEEQKQCITTNRLIKRILLLLRLDGVLEFGKTPLCGNGEPVEFLKRVINESGIEYKDTMLALVDVALEDTRPPFISDDPNESAGEKFDKAVMLLSLLSKEEVMEFGGNDTHIGQDTQGAFCTIFHNEPRLAKVLPLIMHCCPKALEIFKNVRLKQRWGDSDKDADTLAESLREALEDSPLKCIAFDEDPYRNILFQCANSGTSISGWVKEASSCLGDNACDVTSWILEHIDAQVAETIMSREGYYMLSLMDSGISKFESSEEYKELRKYIVDNGYLLDVWHCQADFGDFMVNVAFYEIDTRTPNRNNGHIRFFNFENSYLDEDHCGLRDILFGFDPESSNTVYRFIPVERVASEDYRLDMDLYNSYGYARCQNPVLLGEILSPVEGTTGVYEDSAYVPIYEEGSTEARLYDAPLDNYSEFIKAGDAYRSNGDRKYSVSQALFIRNRWPMKPTWISCKNLGANGGIIVNSHDSENVRVYNVDQSVVYPWYLAYKISNETYQFNLRKNQEGTIDESQFLRMYIDLPSLEDQKKEVEDVINKEIERKKRQVGAVETLFNLSHTIGSPASRIQSLLGNLQDMCMRNPEISSQLKKITDNFDYIIRVIDSTSKDFSSSNDPLKEFKILPILESFISSFSSLPFGIDPMINKERIDSDTRVKIDKTLFSVMMDNILRNAHRHGFDKKVSSENKVSIELDVVQYEGVDHLMLSVRNNGKKMEEGFSVYDYISRGKHGKRTGNTGQGGYDIYQIVKKFNGYLGLRSDDQWNFIIDILIPVIGTDSETLNTPYPYGTLL